jgi:osmoprotectant transport system permease protein
MESIAELLITNWSQAAFFHETGVFLSMVGRALGIALLIGLPVGILLTLAARAASPIIALLALLQTFPSLALLGLLIPVVGIGEKAAVFLAVIYSLFPIVMNTHVGITQVPRPIRDTALGMGMTPLQVLWNVDLPLALPVILAGVRTGAVYAIGIVTICALAGAGGLGVYILRGMTRADDVLIFTGAIPLLLVTLLLFWGLGALAWLSRKNSKLGLMLGGGLIALLAGYAFVEWVRPWFRSGAAPVRLASKNFVEGEILTEIQRQMLEAHTSLAVEVVPYLSSAVIIKSIVNNEIDLYPEYTGNLLTNKDALDLPVPRDKSTITDLVRDQMRAKRHLVVLEPFGLNNTYSFCLKRSVGRKLGLKTLGDLGRVPNLRVVVDLDFFDRPDGWKGMVKKYGLQLSRPQFVDISLRYKTLLKDRADVALGYATDWEIDAFDLVVLQDNKDYFPNYHGVSLVRENTVREHPEIGRVLNRLKHQIDDETMRLLSKKVALEKRPEAEVVREFLSARGLLTKARGGKSMSR